MSDAADLPPSTSAATERRLKDILSSARELLVTNCNAPYFHAVISTRDVYCHGLQDTLSERGVLDDTIELFPSKRAVGPVLRGLASLYRSNVALHEHHQDADDAAGCARGSVSLASVYAAVFAPGVFPTEGHVHLATVLLHELAAERNRESDHGERVTITDAAVQHDAEQLMELILLRMWCLQHHHEHAVRNEVLDCI